MEQYRIYVNLSDIHFSSKVAISNKLFPFNNSFYMYFRKVKVRQSRKDYASALPDSCFSFG